MNFFFIQDSGALNHGLNQDVSIHSQDQQTQHSQMAASDEDNAHQDVAPLDSSLVVCPMCGKPWEQEEFRILDQSVCTQMWFVSLL